MNKAPTTFEIDGLYTEEDIANRHFVMKPCIDCGKYTKQDMRTDNVPCQYCGGPMGNNSSYWASLRTWRSDRKISAADRKKMGA